ncbi:DUF6660 family protein [Maribacter sp. Asnod1-A12]|uniref:DUF6660 family protein n=1 Tax=Maribacter sp. Asnod1-A12 TaxID=3160576 RepID=UPI0038635AFA
MPKKVPFTILRVLNKLHPNYICNPVALEIVYLCIVKFIAVILSLYFLALNVVPCGDDAQISDSSTTEFQVGLDHNQNHGECELCSPFCQCHCCHSHTIVFDLDIFEPIEPKVIQESFSHFESVSEDPVFTLFQPPKIIG